MKLLLLTLLFFTGCCNGSYTVAEYVPEPNPVEYVPADNGYISDPECVFDVENPEQLSGVLVHNNHPDFDCIRPLHFGPTLKVGFYHKSENLTWHVVVRVSRDWGLADPANLEGQWASVLLTVDGKQCTEFTGYVLRVLDSDDWWSVYVTATCKSDPSLRIVGQFSGHY